MGVGYSVPAGNGDETHVNTIISRKWEVERGHGIGNRPNSSAGLGPFKERGDILGGVGRLFDWIVDKVKGFAYSVWSGVKAAARKLVNVMKAMFNTIFDGLDGLASMFRSTGEERQEEKLREIETSTEKCLSKIEDAKDTFMEDIRKALPPELAYIIQDINGEIDTTMDRSKSTISRCTQTLSNTQGQVQRRMCSPGCPICQRNLDV